MPVPPSRRQRSIPRRSRTRSYASSEPSDRVRISAAMIWRPTPAHSTRRLSRHRAPVSWRMIDDTDGLLNGDPYVMRTRASAMLPSVQTASTTDGTTRSPLTVSGPINIFTLHDTVARRLLSSPPEVRGRVPLPVVCQSGVHTWRSVTAAVPHVASKAQQMLARYPQNHGDPPVVCRVPEVRVQLERLGSAQ
jgi:hypothetical protein